MVNIQLRALGSLVQQQHWQYYSLMEGAYTETLAQTMDVKELSCP